MIRRSKKGEEGSIVLWVLLMMSLISILGMIILSIALSNYQYKKLEQMEQISYYIGQGIGELNYDMIYSIFEKAIQEGELYVSDYIQQDVELHPTNYIFEDGTINHTLIQEVINQKFYEEYKDSMSSWFNESQIHEELLKEYVRDSLFRDEYRDILVDVSFSKIQWTTNGEGQLYGWTDTQIEISNNDYQYEIDYSYEIVIPPISIPYKSELYRMEGESCYELAVEISDTKELFEPYTQWMYKKVGSRDES